jgi:leucyl/phenylalanyl-tRNA---protein transferase
MRARTQRRLTPEFLIQAYASGYFPMAESREGPISWYSPDPRAIIPLDTFNVSRSLRQVERKEIFEIRFNTAFPEVITQCAAREDTWISAEIIDSYRQLFEQGVAHSVESWKEGVLAGGLYGVALGGAFFGESMFSRSSDASKIALWALVRRLREKGYLLLDTQFLTPHLATLGACEIPRKDYLRLLRAALLVRTDFISGLERV